MNAVADTRTLSQLLAAGQLSELSYLDADAQLESLQRETFLLTFESDELADAAEFVALAATQKA